MSAVRGACLHCHARPVPAATAGGTNKHVEITLALRLPRDSASVLVVRRVAAQSLRSIGFRKDDVADVELAITEACSNVLRHSRDGDDYEVRVEVSDSTVTVEVLDRGCGFDGDLLGRRDAPGSAEAGRGIQLMRAMVDDVRFAYRPGDGSVVQMTKVLGYEPDTPSTVAASHPAAS